MNATNVTEKFNQVESSMADIATNPKTFGAKGDGLTDDYQALQDCLDYAYQHNMNVKVPAGIYYVSQPIHTRNEKTSFNSANGIKFSGSGKETVLTRKHTTSTGATYSNKTTLANEAVFAIHNNNDIFEEFSINDAKVGFFIGQDVRDITNDINTSSQTHFNRFSKIWMEHVGTGILFKTGYGAYYNTFEKIHITNAQIGVHFSTPFDESMLGSVPNRNSLKDVRIGRSWVGILGSVGDTNTLDTVTYEGIENGASPFVAPSTSLLPDGIPTALYLNNVENASFGTQMWNILNNTAEACTRDVYYKSYGANFISNNFNLQTKFIKDAAGTLGTFIGSSAGGLSDNLHIGGFHVNNPDQKLFPTDGRGIFLEYAIFDRGYDKKSYDLLAACTQIQSVTSDTKSSYWSLGGVREWWIKAEFTPKGTTVLSDPLKIALPIPAHADLKSYVIRAPYYFPVIIQTNQLVVAQFDYATDSIIIPAPSGGWRADMYNYIDLNLRYY
jgi:hypothetical protein